MRRKHPIDHTIKTNPIIITCKDFFLIESTNKNPKIMATIRDKQMKNEESTVNIFLSPNLTLQNEPLVDKEKNFVPEPQG